MSILCVKWVCYEGKQNRTKQQNEIIDYCFSKDVVSKGDDFFNSEKNVILIRK